MSASSGPKIIIPHIDIRNGTPLDLVRSHKDKAVNMLDAAIGAYKKIAFILRALVLPLGDFLSRRWLKKNNNPYLPEIEACEKIVGKSGVLALNLCYEWGCTSGAVQQQGKAPVLMRILDWPFPAMAENMVVARQSGVAGEFNNVTWPGISGVFNAVAQGRFAAALNQAPMRRHSKHIGIFSFIIDWLRNRHLVNHEKGLPPAHLLRHVFETAHSYEEAKNMLTTAPVSLPVIYTLTGTKPGEGCVIERTERAASVREMVNGKVFAANHFQSEIKDAGLRWKAREIVPGHSAARAQCALDTTAEEHGEGFAWFKAPVANKMSRVALRGNAATGEMELMGTAGEKPVTKVFKL